MSQAILKLQQGGEIAPVTTFKVGNGFVNTNEFLEKSGQGLEDYLNTKSWDEGQKQIFRQAYSNIANGINNGSISERTVGREFIDTSGSYTNEDNEYNQAVAHYLNSVLDQMPKSNPNKKEKLSEYLKKNSFAQFFLNENFGGAMPTDLSVWTDLDPLDATTQTRSTKARASLLAKNLADYLSTLSDKEFDTEGSAFKNTQDLKDRIKVAIRGLSDGTYDNSDKFNLAKLGLPSSFFDSLFSNGKSLDMQSNEETKLKADTAALNADPTAKATALLQQFKQYHDSFKGRELITNLNFGSNEQREKAITSYFNKNKSRLNPQKLFETFTNTPELFSNSKQINPGTGNPLNVDLIMNAYLILRNRVKKGDLDQFYLGQPGNYAIAGTEHDDNRAMWAINTYTGKIFEVTLGQVPALWKKYKESLVESLKGLDISIDNSSGVSQQEATQQAAEQPSELDTSVPTTQQQEVSKHQLGGIILYDQDQNLQTMIDEDKKRLEDIKAEKEATKQLELEAEQRILKETGKTKKQLDAGKRVPSDLGFTATDYERMGAMAADIAALGASFIPGYGTAAAGALGIGSTALDAVADFSDDSVGMGEAFKNLAVNTGLTALALIPGMGLAKGGKWMNKVVKWAPRLMAAWAVMGTIGDRQVHEMFDKLKDSNAKFTVEDYKALGRVLQTVATVGVMGVSTLKGRKFRNEVNEIHKSSNRTRVYAENEVTKGSVLSDRGIYGIGKEGRIKDYLKNVKANRNKPTTDKPGLRSRVKNAVNSLRGKTPDPNTASTQSTKNTQTSQANSASTTQPQQTSAAPATQTAPTPPPVQTIATPDEVLAEFASTVHKKGGVLSLQNGGTPVLQTAPAISGDTSWYNNYWNTRQLPGWNPQLNRSRAGVSILGNGHGYGDTLDMAYYKNQQYTSNPLVMQNDLNSFATTQDFQDVNSFINTYNTNVKTLDDDNFFAQKYGTKNAGVQQHNDLFGLMYPSRNDDSNNPYNIGTQPNIEDVYGSSTFLRRGVKFEKDFNSDTPEGQKSRIMDVTLKNGQKAQVYYNADGTIALYNPATNITAPVSPTQPESQQVNPQYQPVKMSNDDLLKVNYQGKLLGKDLENKETTWDKIFKGLERNAPQLIAAGRLAAILAANNRMTEEKKKGLNPALLSNMEQHRNVYGDFASQQLQYQKAANIRNQAGKVRSSDGALNNAVMAEANQQASQLESQGDLQYNQGIAQTSEQAKQLESNNVQQNIATSNENMGRISAAKAALHDLDAALISHNALQKDMYWKDIEYNLKNRNQAINQAEYALENFVANQEATEKLNKYIEQHKPELDELSEKMNKANTDQNQEEYERYKKQFEEAKQRFINGKQAIQNEALKKQHMANVVRAARLFKKGGEIEKINARVRIENLKQYKKDIQNQQKNHLYMLNNLSNVTKSLILKSFGI